MTTLLDHFHRRGVTEQVVRPATRRLIEASGAAGSIARRDGTLVAVWQLRPLRNGCGLLAIRHIAVPAELWCAACDRYHLRSACQSDDDGATLNYTCRATGQLLGQF
jgi:hypothetical protein